MMILGYLGPETMLPMTSIIAGIIGFVMMFGRKAFELALRPFRGTPKVITPKTRARGHRPTTSRTVAPMTPRTRTVADEPANRTTI